MVDDHSRDEDTPLTRKRLARAGPLAGLALLLVLLDLARAAWGPFFRPWQWAAGLLTLVALGRFLRGRDGRWRDHLPVLALAAFLLPTYVDHARRLEKGDGQHYYSYLRSLVFDGDLDLGNDYRLLGWADPSHRNVLPVGAPILWSPLVVAVHLLRQLARLGGAAPPTGVEPIYQAAVCLATLAYGAAALFLLQRTLQRWVGPSAALWATVLCWVGSPLRFYLSVLPGLAHGVEFFAAVLVLLAYLRLREGASPRRAAWAGVACGLVFLARSQDGLLLALPAVELALQLTGARDRRRVLVCMAALLGAFVLVALPQIMVWQAMFGTPVLIPHKVLHGDEFLHLSQPQLAGVLVSPRGGLFTSHPVMLLAVAGFLPLLRRDPRYAAVALSVVLAGWYLNATVFDWYHVRRFTGLVPLLAPGLAVLIAPLTRAGWAAMALLAFLALRYDLGVDALRALPGQPAPVRAVVAETSDALGRDAYGMLEPWWPRGAVALSSAYGGVEVLDAPVVRLDLGAPDQPALRFPLKARNFSDVEIEDGRAARWVRDRDARLFLPVAHPGAAILTLTARPLEIPEEQAMAVAWNGTELGWRPMTAGWSDYRFSVPASAVRAGTNEVVLRFLRGPIYHRVRGEGPREIRPAALSAITLHRE